MSSKASKSGSKSKDKDVKSVKSTSKSKDKSAKTSKSGSAAKDADAKSSKSKSKDKSASKEESKSKKSSKRDESPMDKEKSTRSVKSSKSKSEKPDIPKSAIAAEEGGADLERKSNLSAVVGSPPAEALGTAPNMVAFGNANEHGIGGGSGFGQLSNKGGPLNAY